MRSSCHCLRANQDTADSGQHPRSTDSPVPLPPPSVQVRPVARRSFPEERPPLVCTRAGPCSLHTGCDKCGARDPDSPLDGARNVAGVGSFPQRQEEAFTVRSGCEGGRWVSGALRRSWAGVDDCGRTGRAPGRSLISVCSSRTSHDRFKKPSG